MSTSACGKIVPIFAVSSDSLQFWIHRKYTQRLASIWGGNGNNITPYQISLCKYCLPLKLRIRQNDTYTLMHFYQVGHFATTCHTMSLPSRPSFDA